jgi:TonB family protein
MLRRIGGFTWCIVALVLSAASAMAQSNLTAKASPVQPLPAAAAEETDRMRDGLVGPVRRVRTEVAKLSNESGKLTEGKHALLEMVSYDLRGNKTENQYFPIAGANLTGKEVYKYDDKGNISEMTLVNADGSLLSKEIYKYEFDFAGNWSKMTTSVAVFDGGRISFEPTEVTYRSIMYYLDENMLKMAQPNATTSAVAQQPAMPTTTPANNTGGAQLDNNANAVVTKTPAKNAPGKSAKTNLALPAASNGDKLSTATPIEVANTSSTTSAPVVKLDSEPPPASPKPILKPVSGGVLNGTAINLPAPTYPDAARRMRVAGMVSIDVVVDETGKVISAVATGGPALLRDAAVQAALHARFSPTKLSGQPVKVSGQINYKFALGQ